MTENGNGSYVTWRELNLVILPLKDDLAEVKGDVKKLLAGQAGAAALESDKTTRNPVRIAVWTIAATILAVVLGALLQTLLT